MNIKREQFLWNYIQNGEFPECYEEVTIQNKSYETKKRIKNSSKTPYVTYVSLFPKFLTPKLSNFDEYALKSVHHYNFNGAGIYINKDKNDVIDTYLNVHFNKKTGNNIKRYINRLETSFNIQYEHNFGYISQEKYNILMFRLKEMLVKRFEQKNTNNHFLKDWNENTKNIYNLINKNKASLFVIYDEQKPISISLNYHKNNTILFGNASTFDIDYIKFGLGHLNNYLRLDWCLQNNYMFLDLGTGITDHKKKWCNTFYDFDYHLFYKKNSILAILILYFEIFKIKIKNIIKSINLVDVILKRISGFNLSKKNKQNSIPQYNIEIIDALSIIDTSLEVINIHSKEYEAIRLPTYNYLYSSKENINEVSVFKIKSKSHTYLIRGKKNTIKIIFNK
ncbi:GNAT family N-acetyltransferase [Thalassobellus suaedae]|uniref:GNAT family N-acetyltransferase n=1 Tax=Thalassobellus suaedae TaxID=3074124 RepID=A0ABY9XWA2_9FLAO|nr:GNAT family N-acetyltransferase [Flavobacteriaceae bacterium HL-DH14]WNH12219.1 GNAT family N-acetyltransferase [Flavobacteriaceae bacterium HL-DH10]